MFPPTAWEGFLVTTPSPALYVDLSLTAILAGVRRYLFVVLISVSLIVMLSIFTCTSWPSICLLWRNVYLDFHPVFDWAISVLDIELHELFTYFGD